MATDFRSSLRHRVGALLRKTPALGHWKAYQVASALLGDEPVPFTIDLDCGQRLRVSSAFWQHIFYLGCYERDVLTFLESSVKPGSTAFDVGASIGMVTLALACRAERVFAFDALRANYVELQANLAQNNIENVMAVYAAVSDRDGSVRIPDVGVSGNYSLASTAQGSVEVESITIDAFCEAHKIEKIDVMKIDVEGSETRALRGARRMLEQGRIDCIVAECNPHWLRRMNSSPEELLDVCESYGLKVHLLMADGSAQPASRDECFKQLAKAPHMVNLVLLR